MSTMFLRSLAFASAAALFLSACGSEDPMSSSDDAMVPASKPALKPARAPRTVANVTVTSDGVPQPGLHLAFSRSISGTLARYLWSGVTDADGRVRIEILANSQSWRRGASGYYLALATDAATGEVIHQWTSVPITGGKEIEFELPVGERARRIAVSNLTPMAVFNVRIENVSGVYPFAASGAFTTPVGAAGPAPIGPGDAYEFSFDAPPGSRLSFATMFVHSNDAFYAPRGEGIPLWSPSGVQISGDVTSQILLWDAGTEMDQEPGLGADQAPRQSGPNTGQLDPNGTVRPAQGAFANLPAVSDVLSVTVTPTSATGFAVRITNVSTASTLSTSDGASHAVPLAPGVFVVHTGADPLFTDGDPDRGEGLKSLAEDGGPGDLAEALAAKTGLTGLLAPGAWAVHTGSDPIFSDGMADRGLGLENLAEDGNPARLASALASEDGVDASGAFAIPTGASGPGVLLPGSAYEFSFTAAPGSRLSFATMFVQSNDAFYGPDPAGIPLWSSSGRPISGDITGRVSLWDAGTEADQAPGLGSNQAPHQAGPNTGGADPDQRVRLAEENGLGYPDVASVVRVVMRSAE